MDPGQPSATQPAANEPARRCLKKAKDFTFAGKIVEEGTGTLEGDT